MRTSIFTSVVIGMAFSLVACSGADSREEAAGAEQKTTIAPIEWSLIGEFVRDDAPLTGLRTLSMKTDGTYSARLDYSAVVKCSFDTPDCGIQIERGTWLATDAFSTFESAGDMAPTGVPGADTILPPPAAENYFRLLLKRTDGETKWFDGEVTARGFKLTRLEEPGEIWDLRRQPQ